MLTTVLVIYTDYRNITFSTPFWGFGPTDRYSDSVHGAIRSLQAKDKTVFYARPRSFCLSTHTTVLFCPTIYYLIPHKICRRRFILKLSIPCIFISKYTASCTNYRGLVVAATAKPNNDDFNCVCVYIYIYTHTHIQSDTSPNEDNSFRNHIR